MAHPGTTLVPAATYPAIVGQVLASLRERHEMSQAELAGAAGLKQAAWSKIERGHTALNVEQLMQVARTLDMKPWQILRAADEAAEHVAEEGIKVEPKRIDPIAAGAVLISAAALGGLVGAGLAAWFNTAEEPDGEG